MLPPFVFIDTETTGISLRQDRIIEIAAIRYEDGKITKTFQSLINPHTYLPQEITHLTGITNEDITNAPEFYSIAKELMELFSGAIVVAHNAGFDLAYLQKEFRELGSMFHPPHVCTVKLSRKLFPHEKSHNLDAIMKRFSITTKHRHRAYDDAKVLVTFLKKVEKQLGKDLFEEKIKQVMKQTALPPSLSPSAIEQLPTNPGVYIFYAANGFPLYVGKSINIKERVLSHFYASKEQTKEFRIHQQIHSIETRTTTGELGAFLLELQLIKELQPLYNTKSRQKHSLIAIYQQTNDKGYFTCKRERFSSLSPDENLRILGIFPSERQCVSYVQQLAKDYHLCEKLLGLQKSRSGCFYEQLGICYGACTQKEHFLKYNTRFLKAFESTKLAKWPFPGAIVTAEENEYQDTQFHVFDKWCYLGSCSDTKSVQEIAQHPSYTYDHDVYHLLKKYLSNKHFSYQTL